MCGHYKLQSRWFQSLSVKQRIVLFATTALTAAIIIVGFIMHATSQQNKINSVTVDMSIRQIAPALGVSKKSLACELNLADVSRRRPLRDFNVSRETLIRAANHLLSHQGAAVKYHVFFALALWGLVFLTMLGRPKGPGAGQRGNWYPRLPYIFILSLSVLLAGFLLGKSPNPMEGTVQAFKSMAGLFPDPAAKVLAFIFFIALATIGNKIICGWSCPFGALQELIYTIPVMKRIKQRKMPFAFTNSMRAGLFITMLVFLFGGIGVHKGHSLYHHLNPFNLFNLNFETVGLSLTILLALLFSFAVYRPFCQFICPFGFVSWIAEKISIFRVRIDKKKCTQCGACIRACPLDAVKGIIMGSKMPPDCFSCGRCLAVCPVDAIQYGYVFKNITRRLPDRSSAGTP
ncbi:MAG: 4Fe-4S binding protein [Chitinispirillaceae bacterium]|nr:4Fe-4S binding protein [Chitinispirillaceae bacterium]